MNDSCVELELLYIDDLVKEMISALQGNEHHCEFDGVKTVLTANGRYCAVPVTYKATLGEIVSLLESFKAQPQTLLMPRYRKIHSPRSFTVLFLSLFAQREGCLSR